MSRPLLGPSCSRASVKLLLSGFLDIFSELLVVSKFLLEMFGPLWAPLLRYFSQLVKVLESLLGVLVGLRVIGLL